MNKQRFHKRFIPSAFVSVAFLLLFCVLFVSASEDKVKTPGYYENNVVAMFKNGDWSGGKKLLDEGERKFPNVSALNQLMGQYYLVHKQYDKSRFFLIKSIRNDEENTDSRHMLISLEDEMHNYSSAICYVNELLEIRPYSKTLWLKKISLYRRQGNIEEVDRLLQRLCRIYPNDKDLHSRYLGRLEENFVATKKAGNTVSAIATVKKMLAAEPTNADYYDILSSMLLQQGETTEALTTAERGLQCMGSSTSLARRKAAILSEQHRYPEAISFLKSYMKEQPSGELQSMLKGMEEESAYESLKNDPYIQFAKMYETNHSSEALQFLLNTSITREYNEDALYYIGQVKRRKGTTPKLLYQEAIVQRRLGNTKKAVSLLEQVHTMNPRDMDVVSELSAYHLGQATDLMTNQAYDDALPHLNFVLDNDTVLENLNSALNKKYVCLVQQKKYEKALVLVDSLGKRNQFDVVSLNLRKADVLNKLGRTDESLKLLRGLAMGAVAGTDSSKIADYTEEYENVAVPYIHSLIERGAIRQANEQARALLEICPQSQLGFLYAINTSNQLRNRTAAMEYINSALTYYPNDVDFIIKKAAYFNNSRKYSDAMDLLRPHLDSLSGDSVLIKTYAASCEMYALDLINVDSAALAVSVLDSALYYDSNNNMLLYEKGLAFEKLHMYDSAYVYQKYYRPVSEIKRHLEALQHNGFKDEITTAYLQSRLGEADQIKGIATIAYTHHEEKNSYTGTINYTGREGAVSGTTSEEYAHGGTGIQLLAEWNHIFTPTWNATIGGGWSNKYFPTLQANLKVEHLLKNDWTVDAHIGYRRVETSERTYKLDSVPDALTGLYDWVFDDWKTSHASLINVGVGATKDYEQFQVGGKADLMFLSGKMYFNASAIGRYYPFESEHISNIFATAGLGTAPESSILNYGLPGSFSHINTNVGLGAVYMITSHLSASLMGSWYTFYNQTNVRTGTAEYYQDTTNMRYKNLFNIYLQLNVTF